MSTNNQSREFFDLVKSIGECRSKQEEDRIVEGETVLLKSRLADPSSNPKKLREFLVRAIYVEMLGHDASFAYIHGVNLCHNKSLVAKRIGYLVCCLFLNPAESELMILLINTIQKDLKSTNLLEVSFALIVVSKLANIEMVPALTSLVTPLLGHQSELIRRRATIAFHRMVQVGGIEGIGNSAVHASLRKALGDSDPGVMAVGLNPIWEIAQADPQSCRDLVPSLIAIQRQILDHKLPRDFDYHRMPAPWIQIRLVSILGLLGEGDDAVSATLIDVLSETMRRADINSNAGAAVVFEVIKAAVRIAPSHTLLEHASLMIARFMQSESPNNRYLGVTCLSLLVGVNRAYANEHQVRVVECLEDGDETLRRRTLELLFKMTSTANVTVVIERMLTHLTSSIDAHFKRDLILKICQLAEQFAPSNEWYLSTINQVFLHDSPKGESLVPVSVSQNLTRLVAEQESVEDPSCDLRIIAANAYIGLLEIFLSTPEKNFSDSFLQLTVWMIGEFASLATVEGYSVDDVVDLLSDGLKIAPPASMGFFVSALSKLVVLGSEGARSGIEALFRKLQLSESLSADVRRRCAEGVYVLSLPKTVQQAILPLDGSCEDLDLRDFRFLHAFVTQARLGGAVREYAIPAAKSVVKEVSSSQIVPPNSHMSGLRFEAYEAYTVQHAPLVSPPAEQTEPVLGRPPDVPQLLLGAGRKWGPASSPQVDVSVPTNPSQPVSNQPAKQTPAKSAVASIAAQSEKQKIAAALFSGVPVKPVVVKPVVQKGEDSDLLDLGTTEHKGATDSTILRKGSRDSRSLSDLLG